MSYVASMFKVAAIVCVVVALCSSAQTEVFGGGSETYTLSILKLKDFAKWNAGFMASLKMQKAVGEKSFHLLRIAGDPNTVVLLVGWKSQEAARKFMLSDKLKELRKKAGVLESKDYFLEQVKKDTL